MRRIGNLAICAALCFSASLAFAEDPTAFDYPEMVLAMPEAPPADLAALLGGLADDARNWGVGSGDPSAIEPLLADTVEILIGGVELDPDEAFDTWGTFARADAIAALGDLVSYDDLDRPGFRRRGANRFGELLLDGAVGENPWMPGEICTSAFGKLPFNEMSGLLKDTGTTVQDWRIAALASAEAEFHRYHGRVNWKPGQLLFVHPDAPPIKSCCWQQVVMPAGSSAYVQTFFGAAALRPYLNSHVCFGQQDGAWKVTKIAIRTP